MSAHTTHPGPGGGRDGDRLTGPQDEDAAPAAPGTLGEVPAEADAEKPARVLSGRLRLGISVVAVLLSVYALVNVFAPVPALQYRIAFWPSSCR